MEFTEIKEEEKEELLKIFKFIEGCSVESASLILREVLACHPVSAGKRRFDTISVWDGRITLTFE